MGQDSLNWLKSNRRSYLKAAAAGVTGSVLAGCTGGDGDDEDGFHVTMTQGAGPLTMDPHNHSASETYDTHYHIHEGLTFIDREGEIHPRLASDWERIEDTQMKFYIRENVNFHNGDEMTLEDVEWSIRRSGDDDVEIVSPQSDSHNHIVNIEQVEDDHALIIETDGVDAILPHRFHTGSHAPIMNKEWAQENDVNTEANGTGPYEVIEFSEDELVELELFDNYWGWPYLEERDLLDIAHLTINEAPEDSTRAARVLAGETDLATRIAPPDQDRIDDSDDARLIRYSTDRSWFVKMKTIAEPFDSLEVRKAFNYAVNKEEMAEVFFDGAVQVAGQPIPPSWFGHNPNLEPYSYDPDRARELLNESPYADEQIELEMHTGVGQRSNDLEVTQAVAGYLNDLENVEVDVIERDFADLFETLRGPIEPRPDFYSSTTGGSPADAIAGKMERMFHKDGSGSAWEDEEVSQLIDEAARAPTMEEREEFAQEAERLIHERCPEIFLWWGADANAMSHRLEYESYENQVHRLYTAEDIRDQ